MKLRLTMLATCAILSVIGMTPSVTADENNESDAVQTKADKKSYWIGVALGPVSPELRAHLELPADTGLMVQRVVEGSPADRSEIKKYDIIDEVNQEKVKSRQGFMKAVNAAGRAGQQLFMSFIRKGQDGGMMITPVERDPQEAMELLGHDVVVSGPSIGWGAPIRIQEQHGAMMNMDPNMMNAIVSEIIDADSENPDVTEETYRAAPEVTLERIDGMETGDPVRIDAMDLTEEQINGLPKPVQKLVREFRAGSTSKQESSTASAREANAESTKKVEAKILSLDEKMNKIIELLDARSE